MIIALTKHITLRFYHYTDAFQILHHRVMAQALYPSINIHHNLQRMKRTHRTEYNNAFKKQYN
jgi:hypothetical protein